MHMRLLTYSQSNRINIISEMAQEHQGRIQELEELLKFKDLIIRDLEEKILKLSKTSKTSKTSNKSNTSKSSNKYKIKDNVIKLEDVNQISFPKEHEFKIIDVTEIKKGSYIVHMGQSYKVIDN